MIASENFRLAAILCLASIVLTIPLMAMQFTHEVKWTLADFALGGFLLFGAGFMCEFALRKFGTRLGIMVAGLVLLGLILVWVELGVGIFDSPLSGS